MDPELDDDTDLGNDDDGNDDGGDYGKGYEAKLGHLIVAVLHDNSLDVKAKRKKILKALQLMDDPADAPPEDDAVDDEPVEMDDAEETGDADDDAGDVPATKGDSAECVRVFRTHHDPAVRRLAERFDRLRAKERLRSRRARARQLCERAKLPPTLLSNLFLEQLIHAPDERAMRALIEDRRRLAGVRLPRSTAPGAGGRMDVKEFAKQLRKGA
jgi:hypothetical protein